MCPEEKGILEVVTGTLVLRELMSTESENVLEDQLMCISGWVIGYN